MKFITFLFALISTNIKSSLSLRTSFMLQLVFMILNNFVFFAIWWIFFQKFEDINGWTLSELKAMYGFTALSFGMTIVFCGGIGELSRKIVDGGLDAYLVQPKNALVQAIASQSRSAGWGDIISGGILVAWSGYLNWAHLPIILLLVLSATLVFISAGVIAHSLAFWLGPVEHLSRQLFEFVIAFSVYPQTIFPLLFKIFLFTVIPAGFIGYLPVEVLKISVGPFL